MKESKPNVPPEPQPILDPPEIRVAGLLVRVLGYQIPNCTDGWDADWLWVDAICEAHGAVVTVRGPCVRTTEIQTLREGCERLHRGLASRAGPETMEPYLDVQLEVSDELGHVTTTVKMTPDNVTQHHRFVFEIDQSYLPAIVTQCEAVLARFPIRWRRLRAGRGRDATI